MAKDDLIEDLISKHNDLCDLLEGMKLNPLADFEDLKVDSDLELNYDEYEDLNEDGEEDGKGKLEY